MAIDRVELFEMCREGKTVREMARHFGVTPGRISQVRKELNLSVAQTVTIEAAHRVVAKGLDVVSQLEDINKKSRRLLDEALKSGDKITALNAIREVRAQLLVQLQIITTLADMRAVSAFQEAVLQAIGEVDPDVRAAIVGRLREIHALRKSTELVQERRMISHGEE